MLCACETDPLLLSGWNWRRKVSDNNEALLARGCRRASNCDITSSSTPASEALEPNTSGSSLGCLSTSGTDGGKVMHGLDLDLGKEIASIRLKCAPQASVQYTTGDN